FRGGEERSTEGGTRAKTRVLRDLTCRSCLSAVNEVNAASSAARPLWEHRSEVGAPAPTATL
ncbi:MAG: hypothetical protein KJ832_13880, partial [Gammaproteobacteria bacterium]|nr:hypothetical protein [Gammaproteobacteria bacterium]